MAIPRFPHSDQRMLHAPGVCLACDIFPEWQELREAWGLGFSDPQRAAVVEGSVVPDPMPYGPNDSPPDRVLAIGFLRRKPEPFGAMPPRPADTELLGRHVHEVAWGGDHTLGEN